MNELTKICTKCGIEKTLDRFESGKRSLYGCRGQCRDCRNYRATELRTPDRTKKNRINLLKNNPLYGIWANIIQRCTNKNRPDYERYGGRGITVCKEWLKYENFEKEMLSSHKEGLQIDRIDNSKGYSKYNCKWSSVKEQAINRRNTHFFEFKGIKKTLTDWAIEVGLKKSTLSQRVYSYGWPIEKALTTKI